MANNLKTIIDKISKDKSLFDEIVYDRKLDTLKFIVKNDHRLDQDSLSKMVNALTNAMPYIKKVEMETKPDQRANRLSLLDHWEEAVISVTNEYPGSRTILTHATRKESGHEITLTLDSDVTMKSVKNKKLDLGLLKYYRDNVADDTVLVWQIGQEENLEDFVEKQNGKISELIQNSVGQTKDKAAVRVVYNRMTKGQLYKITDLEEEQSRCVIHAKIFEVETRELRGGKHLITLSVTDFSDSMGVKIFAEDKEYGKLVSELKVDQYYAFEGLVRFDKYSRELMFQPTAINTIVVTEDVRMDNAPEKRIELHLHTNMSEMDGTVSVKDLIGRASDWGHPALAVTDHGVIQAFPDAMSMGKKAGVKIIYGMEGYLYDDQRQIIIGPNSESIDQEYVVFDIETTGFSYTSDHIIEIGAVLVRNREIVETYNALIDPGVSLPSEIIELTGIRDEDLRGKPSIEKVLPEFLEFVGSRPVVAHNADFDTSFIRNYCKRLDLKFDSIVIDTLKISRVILKAIKRHRLSSLVKYYGIKLENHHRAVDDAVATAKIFIKQLTEMERRGVNTMADINHVDADHHDLSSFQYFHCTVLARTQQGLKNLYKLISESHLRYYYRKPRIGKSLVNEYREGLLIGSACDSGEIYQAFLKGLEPEEVLDLASFYDYFEIMPSGNSMHHVRGGHVKNEDALEGITRKIIRLGEITDKPVVATGDVHFMDPDDQIYRRILMAGQKFRDVEQPPLYYKTTEEMLDDFAFLGTEKAKEVVITNTHLVADMISDGILPIPEGTFPPKIEGSEEDLREMCYLNAKKTYGDVIPEIVVKRLERELKSIISNGYAVMYIIAQKLVDKSLEDGYLVGSRGSVGSSLAATMSGITEVNPLPPHYICKKCFHADFDVPSEYGSGVDLPDKNCPHCNIPMKKEGHDIPFEVFLGFEGDKEPDIDLNFAGVYQATSHKYTETLFGKGYVYKAGTIGTIADKTAFGYVKNYFEEREIPKSNREINRLIKGCTGVRRTTGQHPGGIMVVPDYKDIHDFTPIQHPANDSSSGIITTHFDYHSISGRILKLDILGHDVPTIIRQLEELTGINIQDVPLDDQKTVSIFTSTDALNIVDKSYREEIGSLGIPEFGTKFVRQMLKETQPTTFSELVRISGLSHGTDVWINNAQELVRGKVAALKEVISTRDDIMNYLIFNGLPNKEAFTIMERVRKGKGLTDEQVKLMTENDIPKWYIDSCNTIKYMFPKAHAVAYVMMSFRIAYFKVHHPLAFYATYFAIKVTDFDAALIVKGQAVVKSRMKELDHTDFLSKKEQDLYTILEVAYEMYSRGFSFVSVDLYRSHFNEFKIIEDKLMPPLQALSGVGENAAKNIFEEAKKGEFMSKEDLRIRTKTSKTVIEALDEQECLKGLSETNQLQFMDLQNF
jgi:DNA polymerase-3 subunit alpha (Gram-positive type)